MRYLENYITEFSQYYYKIIHSETNLGMLYDKIPYPINFIMNENRLAGLKGRCHLYSWHKDILSKKMD